MPYNTPAWHQHQQHTLEALDALIEAAGAITMAAQGYRADVAADMPSIAKAQQLAAYAVRVVAETGEMTGLAKAAAVMARRAAA